MTKLEILLSYRSDGFKLLDTWCQLGRQKITVFTGSFISGTTKFYSKDMVYILNCEKSAYHNALIYCENQVIDPSYNLNWENVTLLDYNQGYLSFGNNIISPDFKLLLTPGDVGLLAPLGVDSYTQKYPSWTPFVESENIISSVKISEEHYSQVLQVLGYPFVREEELEYDRLQISELALKPALKEMHKWCPVTKSQTVVVTSNVQYIPIPTDCYACVGISLQQMGVSGTGNILSPIGYAYEQAMYGGFSYGGLTGNYLGGSPHTNINGTTTLLKSRNLRQALINHNRRVHYEGPYEVITAEDASLTGLSVGTRYIVAYSNVQGNFNIWWAKNTLCFEDTEYDMQNQLLKLCQAKVMQLFGHLRRQTKSDIAGQVDYKYLMDEGKALEDNTIKELQALVKSSGVLRGSLG